jgi:hypothetical protein
MMKIDHADYVLAKMSVVWPGKPLTVEEVNFWVSKLEPYDFDHAMTALGKIEDRAKFWPSWAEFKEFLDVERRANAKGLPPAPEVPALSKEENMEKIREVRKMLQERRGV